MSNEAPVVLPRIRVLYPTNAVGAHEAIARSLEDQVNRDFAQLPPAVRERLARLQFEHDLGEAAFRCWLASLKIGLAP